MKRILAATLTLALALGLAACGGSGDSTVSGAQSQSGDPAPQPEKPAFVQQDITTEEGFSNIVLKSPDNNASDGFWELFAFAHAQQSYPLLGNCPGFFEGEYQPFYVEPTDGPFEYQTSYVGWYTTELESATDNWCRNEGIPQGMEWGDTYREWIKKITVLDFYERCGIDISAYTYPDGQEGEVTLTANDEDMLSYASDEESYERAKGFMLTENDWMRFVKPEADEDSDEATALLWSNFYNMNHYNDWCKAMGLIYNEEALADYSYEDALAGVIPLDEAGQESYRAVAAELIGYTKNYYEAKFCGADLTAPVSPEFAAAAPMEYTVEWLAKQGLTPENTEFAVDSIYANLYYAFPQVVVNYTVTNTDTGMSVSGCSNFIYKIIEENGAYRYELDYVLETATDDFSEAHYDFEESLTEYTENELYLPHIEELY